MFIRTPRLRHALLCTALLAAGALAVGSATTQAAGKPSIRTIHLVANAEFSVADVTVRNNATRVRVCISGKCKNALGDAGSSLWNVTPAGMPNVRKGQYRLVRVRATNASGSSTVTRRVRVR
jgi:hypothetical protein